MLDILGWVGHDTEPHGKFQPRGEGLADCEVCIAVTAIIDNVTKLTSGHKSCV